MRIDPLDDLAVEFEHEPQHAVRGRVLRPEIEMVVLDLDIADRRLDRGRHQVGRGDREILAVVVLVDVPVAGMNVDHQRFTSSALSGVCAPGACGACATAPAFSSPGSV